MQSVALASAVMRSLRERKEDGSAQRRAARDLRQRLKLIVKKESVRRSENEVELLSQWPSIVNDIEHGMELFQRTKQRKLEVRSGLYKEIPWRGR